MYRVVKKKNIHNIEDMTLYNYIVQNISTDVSYDITACSECFLALPWTQTVHAQFLEGQETSWACVNCPVMGLASWGGRADSSPTLL